MHSLSSLALVSVSFGLSKPQGKLYDTWFISYIFILDHGKFLPIKCTYQLFRCNVTGKIRLDSAYYKVRYPSLICFYQNSSTLLTTRIPHQHIDPFVCYFLPYRQVVLEYLLFLSLSVIMAVLHSKSGSIKQSTVSPFNWTCLVVIFAK